MQRGEIAVSSAGKDKGLWMAVVRTDDSGVYVINGREHPIDKPKRKNPRHLQATGLTVTESDMETNRRLRRALTNAAQK